MSFSNFYESYEKRRRAYVDTKPDDDARKTYVTFKEMKSIMGGPPGFEMIARAYGEKRMRLKEDEVLSVKVSSVWPIREYDRNIYGGHSGSRSEEEVKDLEASIVKDGIKEPGIVIMVIKKSGRVEYYLGEGNHRLALANKHGISSFKVRFVYEYSRV